MKIKGWMLVSAFLIAVMGFACHEARAELNVEAGITLLSGEPSDGGLLIFSERLTPKWEVGLAYASEQECKCRWPADLKENIAVFGNRIFRYKEFELGLGASYWQNTNRALGTNFNISILGGVQLSPNVSLRFRHFSNAGSGTPNLGQDALTLAWSFK